MQTFKFLFPWSRQFFRGFCTASNIETYKITAQGGSPGGVTWTSGKTKKQHHTEHELEVLLGALAGCENSTASYYQDEAGLKIKNLDFKVEADYDFKTHLKNDDTPNRFTELRMQVDVETDGTQQQVDKLKDLVQRHCPINNMLKKSGVNFKAEWKKKK